MLPTTRGAGRDIVAEHVAAINAVPYVEMDPARPAIDFVGHGRPGRENPVYAHPAVVAATDYLGGISRHDRDPHDRIGHAIGLLCRRSAKRHDSMRRAAPTPPAHSSA